MDTATAKARAFTEDVEETGVLLLDGQGAILAIDNCAEALLGVGELSASLSPACLFALVPLTFETHLNQAKLKGYCHFEIISSSGQALSVRLEYSIQRATFITKIRQIGSARLAVEDYRLAFDAAGTGLALLRMSGEWVAANQMLCQMLGYTETELRQTSFQQLTHQDDVRSLLIRMAAKPKTPLKPAGSSVKTAGGEIVCPFTWSLHTSASWVGRNVRSPRRGRAAFPLHGEIVAK
ncbi:hypothetical protein PS645_00349 [Pseudomonas fluorescens]|uniref:PAS domain-containing protein n=1 Tax=Pseudomonas fluorescens TaxID=294 RepID=A0A5E6PHX8_PSEFL|nr:PAS domain-containing protein [Pseudomonas fluorescens]VVM43041.1 hypothetical protein PS645_00349 [Pseudomonas fluorescens]